MNESKPNCGGSPSACQESMGKLAKNGLQICGYIYSHPRCSCEGCDVKNVGRESGNILCCNQHLFTYAEIAMAQGYIVPVEVPYHAQ